MSIKRFEIMYAFSELREWNTKILQKKNVSVENTKNAIWISKDLEFCIYFHCLRGFGKNTLIFTVKKTHIFTICGMGIKRFDMFWVFSLKYGICKK